MFVEFKQHLVHPTVSDSASDIAVRRRYFAVTVIEALIEMFSSADVEAMVIENPEINTVDIRNVNMKTTESTTVELMKFATSFSLLRIELEHMT